MAHAVTLGVPSKIVNLVRMLYHDCQAHVICGNTNTEPFIIQTFLEPPGERLVTGNLLLRTSLLLRAHRRFYDQLLETIQEVL